MIDHFKSDYPVDVCNLQSVAYAAVNIQAALTDFDFRRVTDLRLMHGTR